MRCRQDLYQTEKIQHWESTETTWVFETRFRTFGRSFNLLASIGRAVILGGTPQETNDWCRQSRFWNKYWVWDNDLLKFHDSPPKCSQEVRRSVRTHVKIIIMWSGVFCSRKYRSWDFKSLFMNVHQCVNESVTFVVPPFLLSMPKISLRVLVPFI